MDITFDEFCAHFDVTEHERELLVLFLAYTRSRMTIEALSKNTGKD